MAFSIEIEAFIKTFIKDLLERNVAIFAGAGMSVAQGYVNWPELLREIGDELGLSVDREKDLISMAQYHVNENAGRAGINRKIIDEFTEEATTGENHEILARLPITTYWTTNYDQLIEKALEVANKRADVKHSVEQLANTRPKRDAVVYKMHGDVTNPAKAIITKQDYQSYYKDHEAFVTALSGDLVSKTFLFIGFSFSDPNLEYVLGRLSIQFGENSRQHYAFIKRLSRTDYEDDDSFNYDFRRQQLMVNDLSRSYRIKALLIDDYGEITEVLRELERRLKKLTVFISGSAEEYGTWTREDAQKFIHSLSRAIVLESVSIVNGFGWGVGSAVINGALEGINSRPKKFSQDQLILRPFPQFETGGKGLAELWEEYRQHMISLAGIAIFVFGNKLVDKQVVNANGVRREFEIALAHKLIPIPIGITGYETKQIFDDIAKDPKVYYGDNEWIFPLIEELANNGVDAAGIVAKVIKIIKTLQE